MITIPMIIEFGDIATKYPEKAELVMALLSSADLLIFVQTWLTYNFMRKMVTSISYNNETDKLTLNQDFGSVVLGAKSVEYEPKEIEKYGAKTLFNRTLGYRTIRKGEPHQTLGTENKGAIWHDRKLYETIISQPGERVDKMVKKKKETQYEKKARRNSYVE